MGNFIDMIFKTQSTTVFRTYCGPYITFCLFSESQVSSLQGSQSICSEINASSWPTELSDAKIHQVFHEYIHNYSLHNVILNAEKIGEAWFWIKAAQEVEVVENITAENDLLVYNRNPAVPDHWAVCTIECKSAWTDFNSTGTKMRRMRLSTISLTLQNCKEECEEADDCSSVGMATLFVTVECSLYGYPYDPGQMESRKSSYHVINRLSKTAERCIGDYKGKKAKLTNTQVLTMAGLAALLALFIILIFYLVCCASEAKSGSSTSS